MRIIQILESASVGGMDTSSVATAPSKNGKMIRRQKPTDNALDSGKLFQETNATEGKDEKIAQLKQDYKTAVHWSENARSPQEREEYRRKALKIKNHLEKQYKQGVAEGSGSNKTHLAMAYLKAVVMAPMGTPEKRRILNWQQILSNQFDIEMDTAALAQMLPQLDSMLQAGKLDKLQNQMARRGELEIGEAQQGVAEGSGPKEKQKTPYRDINSPEYRAAADKQKQKMAKDKAAEPGKKMLAKQGVAEAQVDELSKDTLKQYIPRRIEKTKGLAKTDYDKAHRIIKKDIPRAMSKYKDPNYGKAQPTSPVDENKKGVRAVKHTTKPRNFVAKNAVATTSGAGAHKDKKKAMKQGETKHKGKEPAYESRLWAALERRIIK